jgi:hypothetical protein
MGSDSRSRTTGQKVPIRQPQPARELAEWSAGADHGLMPTIRPLSRTEMLRQQRNAQPTGDTPMLAGLCLGQSRLQVAFRLLLVSLVVSFV